LKKAKKLMSCSRVHLRHVGHFLFNTAAAEISVGWAVIAEA